MPISDLMLTALAQPVAEAVRSYHRAPGPEAIKHLEHELVTALRLAYRQGQLESSPSIIDPDNKETV